jgi:hypothetical protein
MSFSTSEVAIQASSVQRKMTNSQSQITNEQLEQIYRGAMVAWYVPIIDLCNLLRD